MIRPGYNNIAIVGDDSAEQRTFRLKRLLHFGSYERRSECEGDVMFATGGVSGWMKSCVQLQTNVALIRCVCKVKRDGVEVKVNKSRSTT